MQLRMVWVGSPSVQRIGFHPAEAEEEAVTTRALFFLWLPLRAWRSCTQSYP
jgi:hypothetical protein